MIYNYEYLSEKDNFFHTYMKFPQHFDRVKFKYPSSPEG
jgi:hypothetical protein